MCTFFGMNRKVPEMDNPKIQDGWHFFKMATNLTQFYDIKVWQFGRLKWNLVSAVFGICRKDPVVEPSKNRRWLPFFKMATNQPCLPQFYDIKVSQLVCALFGICRKDPVLEPSQNLRWSLFSRWLPYHIVSHNFMT